MAALALIAGLLSCSEGVGSKGWGMISSMARSARLEEAGAGAAGGAAAGEEESPKPKAMGWKLPKYAPEESDPAELAAE